MHFATREQYQRFHRRRYATLLTLLKTYVPQPVNRFLDIGGGGDIGDLAPIVRSRFARELHAVDLGADVELARSKDILAKTCNIDNEDLPYESGFFDLTLFASVIEHLYNPHRVIGEIQRTLRVGGLLILEAPNAIALGRRLDALMGTNPFRTFNRYNAIEGKAFMADCSVFYTTEEVQDILANGFEVLIQRYAMHDPPANPLKAFLRDTAFRLSPRLGDCFFVVARRRS
jgi:SAM-dependent methyltransferase